MGKDWRYLGNMKSRKDYRDTLIGILFSFLFLFGAFHILYPSKEKYYCEVHVFQSGRVISKKKYCSQDFCTLKDGPSTYEVLIKMKYIEKGCEL